jgi:hypothetical protein
MDRTKARDDEMTVIGTLREDDPIRPLVLVCPNCLETEPHTRVSGDGGATWLLICWGCTYARPE